MSPTRTSKKCNSSNVQLLRDNMNAGSQRTMALLMTTICVAGFTMNGLSFVNGTNFNLWTPSGEVIKVL